MKVLKKNFQRNLNQSIQMLLVALEGSHIYNAQNKKIISCPAFASKVTDKVGTGDAMLAMLAIIVLQKTISSFLCYCQL